jgi:hypothetical protein
MKKIMREKKAIAGWEGKDEDNSFDFEKFNVLSDQRVREINKANASALLESLKDPLVFY